MPHTLPGQVNGLTCLLVCAAAFIWGRYPERLLAAALLVALVAAGFVQDRNSWLDPQRRLLLIDGTLFLLLGSLLGSSRRKWLIPAAAAQALSCASHFMILYMPSIHARAYLTAIILWSYVVLGSLGWGVISVARSSRPWSHVALIDARLNANPERQTPPQPKLRRG